MKVLFAKIASNGAAFGHQKRSTSNIFDFSLEGRQLIGLAGRLRREPCRHTRAHGSRGEDKTMKARNVPAHGLNLKMVAHSVQQNIMST